MVRGGSRAPSTGRAPSVNKLRKKRDKSYRVQLESVMTKKKKLKLHNIHGITKPLNGYTFLPVGFADLAEECKEMSRKKDADVGVVSAGGSAGQDPSKISHHIYRVGYHFRTDVFDVACNKLGYAERNGKLVKVTGRELPNRLENTMSRYGSRFDLIDLTNRSEAESNKVKTYIRELFPRIPEADLQEIYERAWEQGADTVGHAEGMSLSRQVQLATLARIRHTYTDYDHLLRVGSWRDARLAVEHRCLEKLIEWRGEHEQDTEELEEILRETIVIDDESDDDAESPVEHSGAADSDLSLEIIQHTVAPKDLHVESDEVSHFRRLPRSDGVVRGRALPAVVQQRWQDARSEQFSRSIHEPDLHATQRITVPLDDHGMAPRAVEAGGMTYVRISPERQEHTSQPLYPEHAVYSGYRLQNPRHGTVPVHHEPLTRAQYPQQRVTRPGHPDELRNLQPGPHRTAVQSIERPYEIIDLVSPSRNKHRVDSQTTAMTLPYDDRHHHSTWSTSAANNSIWDDQSRSHFSANSAMHDRPISGPEHVDLTEIHTASPFGREILRHQDHRATQPLPPPRAERAYHQPMFGQPAFPQPRPHFNQAAAIPPRPVHGAPSIPPFGAQLPQPDLRPARRSAFPRPAT